MKRSPIRKISKKKEAEKREEVKIRQQLIERCNGCCEECGEPARWPGLSPHETIFRSHGGKMSLDNSKMLCIGCHGRKHGVIYSTANPYSRLF